MVFLPDSLIRDTLQYEFSKIKEVAYRRKWTKELYKMIFVNPRKINIDIVQTENSEDRYKDVYKRQPFKVDYTLRVGYRGVCIWGNYSLTNMFNKNRAPELRPFAVGFGIMI